MTTEPDIICDVCKEPVTPERPGRRVVTQRSRVRKLDTSFTPVLENSVFVHNRCG